MKAAILFCANNTKIPETLNLVAEYGYTRIVEGTDTHNCIVGNHVVIEGPDVDFDRWFFEQGTTGVWFNTNACIQLELFEHLVHVGVVTQELREIRIDPPAPFVPKLPAIEHFNPMVMQKDTHYFQAAVSASVLRPIPKWENPRKETVRLLRRPK